MNKAIPTCLPCLLAGCATNSNRAYWAYADFNKLDKNYLEFPTNKLKIGFSKSQVVNLVGSDYEIIEASSEAEVIMFEKWKSVPGPDYIDKKLIVRFENTKVVNWKVEPGPTILAPLSW